MNDQELATAIRKSVDAAHMNVPEEQIVTRARVIRAARRRRVAAGITAVVSAGAAAIAAAVVLPGAAAPAAPAAQHAQDTAYVVSHATQALDAMPADTIFYMQSTVLPPGPEVVTDMWSRGLQFRHETFRAGQLVSESGSATTSTTSTQVVISYRDRTWSSRSASFHRTPSAPSAASAAAGARARPTCDSVNKFVIPSNASMMAAVLHSGESCGWLKADGTATVGGVTAIRLTMPADGGAIWTWYVNPATYLPIHVAVTQRGGMISATIDFQWLPPTAANLAKLALPTPPRGFTQVPMR